MSREIFTKSMPPESFRTRNIGGKTSELIRRKELTLGDLEREKLKGINAILNHPALQTLIGEGKITLGIIKPQAYDGKGLPEDDDEAVRELMQEIGEENIVFSFSTKLTPDHVDKFYADVKDQYSRIKVDDITTVWDTIYNFGFSGPLTFILIYREEGDAVEWWRNRMGKTRASEADPESIRGKHAIEERLPNNLTHGSDSVTSVKQEVGVLREVVGELNSTIELTDNIFPSTELLFDIGVIEDKSRHVSTRLIFETKGGEGYVYGFEISQLEDNGDVNIIYLKAKHSISMSGDNTFKANTHLRRIKALEAAEIPQPKLYGVKGATIYQEFVTDDGKTEVLERLGRRQILIPLSREHLDQLIDIAKKLDSAGFNTLNFISDLIFDNKTNRFLYIDAGSDLGDPMGQPTAVNSRQLMERFRHHSDYIMSKL